MFYVLAILLSLLLVSTALAAPSPSRLAARIERRDAARQSQPLVPVSNPSPDVVTNSTQHSVNYSFNWAGAYLDSPAGTYKSATTTFIVPKPSRKVTGSAAAWVGIDGTLSCGTAILQTGIDFTVNNKGHVSYAAWYEWFPAPSIDFTGFKISAGDRITLTVIATTTTSGIAEIKNHTTGKFVSKALTSVVPLCEKAAEWIVEDFQQGGSIVPFSNFGTVTFTKAHATTNSGKTVNPASANIVDIEQNGVILTHVKKNSKEVVVKYV
ncbi:hypothetical protein FRB96_008333 [Tulasnella sp. 330]|nr:hypothetical protein FRB96_008333 [Tulasnella sp. 330]